jgi:hypothetical protein
MGSKKIKAPAPRDYRQEMLDAVAAQEAVQPRLIELEKQYAPMWADVQRRRAEAYSGTMMDFIGQNIPRSAQLTQQYAEGMQPAFSAIGASARGAYEQTLAPETRGLLGTLGQQAQAELARGTGLTAEETRLSQQAARAAMAARGLQGGNQAVAAEVLGNYNLGQARQAQARQFASGVYGMGQQAAQQAMGMYGNTMLGQAAAMSPVGMYSLGQTGNIFQPESQYNAQLITANRQEAMQAQMANAQSRAGLTSGILGAVGTIGGAMLGGPMGAALGSSLMGGLGGGGGAATPQLGASFMNRVGGGMGDYTLGGTYFGNYSD